MSRTFLSAATIRGEYPRLYRPRASSLRRDHRGQQSSLLRILRQPRQHRLVDDGGGTQERCIGWINDLDPKSVLIGHFMASPLGPQMMEALEGEGEAIRYLANLPPHSGRGRWEARGLRSRQADARSSKPAPFRAAAASRTQAPPTDPSPERRRQPAERHPSLPGKDDVADYVQAGRRRGPTRKDGATNDNRVFRQMQGWRHVYDGSKGDFATCASC